MVHNQSISKILLIFMSDLLRKYEIDKTIENKFAETLFTNFQELNKLLENNYILYSEQLNKTEAEESIVKLDKLYSLLKSAFDLVRKEIPDYRKNDIVKEYKNIILHFNNEYESLNYVTTKHLHKKIYTASEAIEIFNNM